MQRVTDGVAVIAEAADVLLDGVREGVVAAAQLLRHRRRPLLGRVPVLAPQPLQHHARRVEPVQNVQNRPHKCTNPCTRSTSAS